MVLYRTYIEDVTGDPDAVDRGFLHADNQTAIYYGKWLFGPPNERGEWLEPAR